MLMVREATPADAEALEELYFRHLTRYPVGDGADLPAWREQLAAFAADPMYHLLVGEIGGQVVSSVTLVVIPNLTHGMRPYAVMENVVTHADHRGKGYASQLIQAGKAIAREHGCYKVSLETGSTRESTLRFYTNNGFVTGTKTAFLMRLP